MIKFRQKDFTIQEGHFTGTKDEQDLPSTLEVLGKTTIGGAIIGGIIGKLDKDSTIKSGAITGAKYGALSGVALKLLINYLHKPMSKIKYQEVDKGIRRQFGIYKAAGFSFGDKLDKRASMEERFAFNDRNVCKYKICVAVQDDKLTMYTLNLTDQELQKLNDHLDYYCKKYYGVNYTATVINQKVNSYSVCIDFTNYQAISTFLVELSEKLQTKIDLLDSNAIVKSRIEEEGQRSFSVKPLNKYDALKLIGKNGTIAVVKAAAFRKPSALVQGLVTSLLDVCETLTNRDYANAGIPVPREHVNNSYLEDTLKRLHYIEGFQYTLSKKDSANNISMVNGLFIVTVKAGSEEVGKLDKTFWSPLKTKIRRTETKDVVVYNYSFQNRQEFDLIIKKLMSIRIVFNIFD